MLNPVDGAGQTGSLSEPGAGEDPPIRVLLAKPGLDGHDRGIKIIIRALWEAGMEVIYTGMRIPPEGAVLAAIQEDVDALGVSNHSGAHRAICKAVAEGLEASGSGKDEMLLFCGGAIPPSDVPYLKSLGYRGVFPPGTRLETIVNFLKSEIRRK